MDSESNTTPKSTDTKTLKCLFWNVEGLFSSLKDPVFTNCIIDHDLLFFVETWTDNTQNIDIPGYECFSFHRQRKKKKSKRNSGGIILYCKNSYSKGIKVVKNHNDSIVWIQLSSVEFNLPRDIMLAVYYVVPAYSSSRDLIDIDVFNLLESDIAHFEDMNENIDFILVGDFNARTKNCPDYIEYDNNLYVPVPDDYIADNPSNETQRCSCDKREPDEFGRKLLALCQSTGLRILNGRFGNDDGIGKLHN